MTLDAPASILPAPSSKVADELTYFVGLGTGLDQPKYLRFKGSMI
jgi:hypothetical protein